MKSKIPEQVIILHRPEGPTKGTIRAALKSKLPDQSPEVLDMCIDTVLDNLMNPSRACREGCYGVPKNNDHLAYEFNGIGLYRAMLMMVKNGL